MPRLAGLGRSAATSASRTFPPLRGGGGGARPRGGRGPAGGGGASGVGGASWKFPRRRAAVGPGSERVSQPASAGAAAASPPFRHGLA